MLLEMASSTYGEREAVRSGDESWSYTELFRAAGAVAERVRDSGASHIALLDVSSPAVPIGLFAAAWAGVPFVPLNYRLTRGEIQGLLARIAPALLITDDDRAEEFQGLADITPVTRRELLRSARAGGEAGDSWPMEPEDIAVLLFTSGTTGAPKAAVIRHRHLVSYILGSVEFASADDAHAGLVSVPPYHIAAMAAVASSIYSGRRIVQLPAFSPEAWLELARRERVSHAFVVPTMMSRIIDALKQDDPGLPDLRALSYGGGKMPQAVIERALARFPGVDFTNAYGLTETSSTVSILSPDDHRAALQSSDPAQRRRLISVGRPLPTLEVEIRDDEGRPCATGKRGEIHVRGEQVSGEYLGRGSLLTDDGWFPTRDGGMLDEEGYLFIEGRIDDVIVRGGENISPGEIEDVLLEHPDVLDVAVVGVPDEQWGEAVAAALVLRTGANTAVSDLQQWVKDRLRSSRTPERVVVCAELPYNETGKLLRREVRSQLAGAG